jgi:hypothetical protein
MDLKQRREEEVTRQKKRNKKDLLRVAGYIVMLIVWSMVLVGFADIVAGGW